MAIKFSEMEPDVQQSALRVIESQFEKSCINGSGYEIAAAAIVKTIVSAYQELYVVGEGGRCGSVVINNVVIHDGGPE